MVNIEIPHTTDKARLSAPMTRENSSWQGAASSSQVGGLDLRAEMVTASNRLVVGRVVSIRARLEDLDHRIVPRPREERH